MGWRLVRVGGTFVLVGTVAPTPAVGFEPEQIVRRLLTIRGVHNYVPRDLVTAVDFLAGPGRAFPFAELVAESHALKDVQTAFERALDPSKLRVAVRPGVG
jgi:threonine dehydrogenase-like Zn-dependent dehydrogenase